MVDLMSLEEQADKDFIVARCRAWMRRLLRRLWGRAEGGRLLSFRETRRSVRASSGVA